MVSFAQLIMRLQPILRACSGDIPAGNALGDEHWHVAPTQQRMKTQQSVNQPACQCFPRFGTMNCNFSIDLRRFRWQAQKA
jgi:hypothetical protein